MVRRFARIDFFTTNWLFIEIESASDNLSDLSENQNLICKILKLKLPFEWCMAFHWPQRRIRLIQSQTRKIQSQWWCKLKSEIKNKSTIYVSPFEAFSGSCLMGHGQDTRICQQMSLSLSIVNCHSSSASASALRFEFIKHEDNKTESKAAATINVKSEHVQKSGNKISRSMAQQAQ
jgi:hypothetical protein